eukprot:CAMPEP_0172359346 /NCGR_PEP_ID=MMETSP1060-20121228/3558_1 /TAXON_ID=37318 /ORGANISM="Pseudo-nitzschia pungens, Strain cf. cingulata" /LENGTH=258 /DNA_ID=CAMNT_0013080957 /DNA_START=189 /DNA_END=965 /DNA_ORIENTATION=-
MAFRLSCIALLLAASQAFVLRTPSSYPFGSSSSSSSCCTTTTTKLASTTDASTDASLLSVTLEKPLGVVLEEVEEGQPKGVYVLELAEDGSAAASEFKDQLVGLPLARVEGTDVTAMDFDSVMDQLIAAPSPISLDFVLEPAAPADADADADPFPIGTTVAIKVLDNNGVPETIVEARVGDNLRTTLQQNNIEVYQGLKQKLGNCGGGGQCTFCAAEFVESEGWAERSDYEDQRLAKSPTARLTCLNNIQGPATIRLV